MIHYITTNGIGNAWVAAELQNMHKYEIPTRLHSMRPPHQNFFGSEWAQKMNEDTNLLYPIHFLSVLASLFLSPFLFHKRFFSSAWIALFGKKENFRVRAAGIAHFIVACDWARKIRHEKIDLIHSQWIQSGGTIGWYASRLLNKPFSFTGHAVDLFRERAALKDKIRDASFIVAISEFHKQFYIQEGAQPDKIHIVYCGIDLSDFNHDYHAPHSVPRILSFGRLIEKKGFDTLIEACAVLRDKGVDFYCEIAGNGPDESLLNDLVDKLKLHDKVNVTGKALLQEDIPAWLSSGDIFAQPCCWSKDNDVDGIPRSLMEAMAVGLPSISTRIAGIPDLVVNEETGLLIEAKDPTALANALERLINDPELGKKLSFHATDHLHKQFNLDTCLQPLADIYRTYLTNPQNKAS